MYTYKVIHEKTKKVGQGESISQALHSIGEKEYQQFHTNIPYRGYYFDPYITKTLSHKNTLTRVPIGSVYEVCGVYLDASKKDLILTVYRAENPKVLDSLATVAKSKRKSK